MADFMPAFRILERFEGYYSNLKTDAGGETYLGISRKYWPECRIWPMVDMEKEERKTRNLPQGYKLKNKRADGIVQAFYLDKFWNRYNLPDIHSQKTASFIFCQVVNQASPFVVMLQHRLGVTADGKIGPKTVEAINSLNDQKSLTLSYDAAKERYGRLGEDNPNYKGWINRIDGLMRMV